MKNECPFCRKAMEVGFIEQYRGGLFAWKPINQCRPIFTAFFPSLDKSMVRFGTDDNFFGSTAKLFFCRDCRKMILDLDDDNPDT